MSNNKPVIQQIVVVEGKTDTAKLKSLFDVQTIETNGSCLNKKTLSLIQRAAEHPGIILFLDPDGPGEKIRKQIMNVVDHAQQCFIKKSDMQKNSKKIGVAEAEVLAIKEAFANLVSFQKRQETLSLEDYNSLNICSVQQRQKICTALKISLCNNKQLLKRLNMLGISKQQLQSILEK